MTPDDKSGHLPAGGSGRELGADAAVEARTVSGEVVREAFSLRSSRYPAPKDLREYEQIYPGFTGEMLGLTKRETEHRLEQEKLQTDATIRLANRGQLFGFITVMTIGGGSIAAVLTGHSVAGFAGIVVAAATLVGAFIAPNIFGRNEEMNHLQLPEAEEATQLSQEPPPTFPES